LILEDPHNPLGYIAAAEAYNDIDRPALANNVLRYGLRALPGNAQINASLLGVEPPAASTAPTTLEDFLRIIEADPMDPEGYLGAAEAYIGSVELDLAEAILRQGLEMLPDNASISNALAQFADSSDDLDEELGDELTDQMNNNPHYYSTALSEFFADATGHTSAILTDLQGFSNPVVVAVKEIHLGRGNEDYYFVSIFAVENGSNLKIEFSDSLDSTVGSNAFTTWLCQFFVSDTGFLGFDWHAGEGSTYSFTYTNGSFGRSSGSHSFDSPVRYIVPTDDYTFSEAILTPEGSRLHDHSEQILRMTADGGFELPFTQ